MTYPTRAPGHWRGYLRGNNHNKRREAWFTRVYLIHALVLTLR